MTADFNAFETAFSQQSMQVFSDQGPGTLWLKLKAIMRKDCLQEFEQQAKLSLSGKTIKEKFSELYSLFVNDLARGNDLLDAFLRQQNEKLLQALDQESIIADLYKLQHYEWGGDYRNSLDKFLVSRYIKHPFYSYATLCRKLDSEVRQIVRGYLLNSWYNHWSSIVIEHIFKAHPAVLPTVGQVKGVDFFLANIPFDLKITYFPNEFMKLARRQLGLLPEITYLKQQAKNLSLRFDVQQSESAQFQQITAQLNDLPGNAGADILETLSTQRQEILARTQKNPRALLKWLYEHQGEMRFGAENRLFLILVDSQDFAQSWKLKRNINWLLPGINSYLDVFLQQSLDEKMSLRFSYKNKTYQTLTDVLFMIK